MPITTNRSTAVLLVLIALVACANAQPDAPTPDGFDDVDWSSLFSVGTQFSDMLANEQSARMAMSPMSSNSGSHASPRSAPTVGPSNAYDMGGPNPWGMSMNGEFRIQQVAPNEQFTQSSASAAQPSSFGQVQSMAAPSFQENVAGNMDQWPQPGDWNSDPAPTANDDPLHSRPAPATPSPSQHVHANSSPGALQPLTHNWSFAPQLQHASYIYQTTFQLNNQGYQPPVAQASMIPRSYPEPSQTSREPNLPEILSADATNNYNCQESVSHGAVGNMRGWIGRAPTTGDRAVPRLGTNLLAPQEHLSAARSPTSASTTSSSRPSSRRKPWEMTIGDFICDNCNAGFPTQGDLTHHLRSHAPYTSRQHVCDRCHKRFQYRKDLHRHLPKHDPNRKKFYCPLPACKYYTKGFGRIDHLERHLASQHRLDTPLRASRSRWPPSTNLMIME